MGLHGAVGLRKNGVDKVGYNAIKSNPMYLGNSVLRWLRKNTTGSLNDFYESLQVSEDAEVEEAWNWDKNELNCSFKDRALFLSDSLLCSYAYIINLDTNKFEVYVGYNIHPRSKGRYASTYVKEAGTCYGVALIKEYELLPLCQELYAFNKDSIKSLNKVKIQNKKRK